jgi:hypothetical protein
MFEPYMVGIPIGGACTNGNLRCADTWVSMYGPKWIPSYVSICMGEDEDEDEDGECVCVKGGEYALSYVLKIMSSDFME